MRTPAMVRRLYFQAARPAEKKHRAAHESTTPAVRSFGASTVIVEFAFGAGPTDRS
jgi:hypothetical protein